MLDSLDLVVAETVSGSTVNLPWKPVKIDIQILEEEWTIPASEIEGAFDNGKVIFSRGPGGYKVKVKVKVKLVIADKTPWEKETTPPGIKMLRVCIRGP